MCKFRRNILNKIGSKKKAMIDWFELCASASFTLLVRTHVKRWQKVAYAGAPPWDERNEIIAAYIPEDSLVLDIGCGAQTLRKHLRPGCKYQPCDIIKSSPDVIFCDLNSGIYPDIKGSFDYVVCSGVFEYIHEPKEFLEKVPLLGRTMLMSYNPLLAGDSKFARLGNNWVNHLTKAELEMLFSELGLEWTVLHTDKLRYLIYSIRSVTGGRRLVV
jgi:Methionine biosynthesis protein MetW